MMTGDVGIAKVLNGGFMLLALATLGASPTSGASLTPPEKSAEEQASESRPVENVAIVDQKWAREGGLFIVEVTFDNANRFPLVHVIIACDFAKPGGAAWAGSRGSLVPRIISPGRTTVGGIEFVMSERDAEGGSCRVLSAQRLWTGVPGPIDASFPSPPGEAGTFGGGEQ